jgi:hypothetical protein
MNIDLVRATVYITAYVAWASLFRSRIDPWLREHIGSRFGIEVVWVPALSFPVRAWTWGLSRSANERLDSRLALGSAMTCLTAGCLPAAILCALSRWTTYLSPVLGHALYLASTPLLLFFLVSQMQRPAA